MGTAGSVERSDLLSPGWTQLRQRDQPSGLCFPSGRFRPLYRQPCSAGTYLHISESGFLVSGADWDAELNLDAVYAGSLPVDAGDLIAVDLDLNKLVYHYEVMDVEYINDAKRYAPELHR